MDAQTNTATPSLIQMLHARFEANNSEYERIEQAYPGKGDPGSEDPAQRIQITRALEASVTEETALKRAILTQVPNTHAEALVLMFHIRLEQDAQSHAAQPVDDEAAVILRMAIDTLFDFHASQDQFAPGEMGERLLSACNTAFAACQYRTGQMGGR